MHDLTLRNMCVNRNTLVDASLTSVHILRVVCVSVRRVGDASPRSSSTWLLTFSDSCNRMYVHVSVMCVCVRERERKKEREREREKERKKGRERRSVNVHAERH
jgi:hypothetical protein